MYAQKCQNKVKQKGMVKLTHKITIWMNFKHTENLMLSKHYESIDRSRPVELGYMCPRGLLGPPAVELTK